MIPPPYSSDNLRTERDNLGRFAPGNAGKPLGAKSKNKIGRETLSAINNLSSLAVSKLRELVNSGEFQAIKLVIDLTVPKGGRLIEFSSSDPNEIADQMVIGEITVDEAARAAQALGKLTNIAEIQELIKRLDELEAMLAENRK